MLPTRFSLRPQRADAWLLLFYAVLVGALLYCYPVPQISWDSNYYVGHGTHPGLRPIGYSVLLRVLHAVYPRLWLISVIQAVLAFVGVRVFCGVLGDGLGWTRTQVCGVSALLLLEPAGLAHEVAVLSDSLFATLTLLWAATLLALARRPGWRMVAAHGVLLVLCLQTRHLAQCFPIIACVVLVAVAWQRPQYRKGALLGAVGIVCLWQLSNAVDRARSQRYFGVAIQTPFSGWTDANNAFFALPYLHTRALRHPDPVVQALHRQFLAFRDTASFAPDPASSDYLWDARSPLYALRQHWMDSLHISWDEAWFLLAPRFGAWGSAVRNQHPGAYVRGFVLPNAASLLLPHTGEMADYYIASTADAALLERYGIRQDAIRCRYQPFKGGLNVVERCLHVARLLAVVLVAVGLLRRWGRLPVPYRRAFAVLLFVGAAYYGAMLISSRIMPRYIIPVLQLETAFLAAAVVLARSARRHPKAPQPVISAPEP